MTYFSEKPVTQITVDFVYAIHKTGQHEEAKERVRGKEREREKKRERAKENSLIVT